MNDTEKLIEHINKLNREGDVPEITFEEKYNKEKLEELLDKRAPKDFIDFLVYIGNDEPMVNVAIEPESKDEYTLKYFSPVILEWFNPIDGSDGIEANLECYEDRMPTWAIPFAPAPCGDAFVISCHKSDYGSVYLWLHEEEYVDEEDGELDDFRENLVHLANSFTEFILKMKIPPTYDEIDLEWMSAHVNEINEKVGLESLPQSEKFSTEEVKSKLSFKCDVPRNFLEFYSLVGNMRFDIRGKVETNKGDFPFEYFLPLHGQESIESFLSSNKSLLSAGFLPFGLDSKGHLFLLSLRELDFGEVYLVRDYNEKTDIEMNTENLYLVIHSFFSFVTNLHSNEIQKTEI